MNQRVHLLRNRRPGPTWNGWAADGRPVGKQRLIEANLRPRRIESPSGTFGRGAGLPGPDPGGETSGLIRAVGEVRLHPAGTSFSTYRDVVDPPGDHEGPIADQGAEPSGLAGAHGSKTIKQARQGCSASLHQELGREGHRSRNSPPERWGGRAGTGSAEIQGGSPQEPVFAPVADSARRSPTSVTSSEGDARTAVVPDRGGGVHHAPGPSFDRVLWRAVRSARSQRIIQAALSGCPTGHPAGRWKRFGREFRRHARGGSGQIESKTPGQASATRSRAPGCFREYLD